MAAKPSDISDSTRIQVAALRSAVDTRSTFAALAESAAEECESACGQYAEKACADLKLRAMTANIELGRMKTQLAQSEETGKKAGTQVALWAAYCPDGSHFSYDSAEVAHIAHKGHGCKIIQK